MAVTRQMTTAGQEAFPETHSLALDGARLAPVTTGMVKAYDFHDLINSFIGYVRRTIECDGIEYELDDINLYYVDGELERSSTSYNLSMGDEDLGIIRFTRSVAFHKHELVTIENMLAGLIEPLRHTLSFCRSSGQYRNNCHRYFERLEMEIERCHRNGRDFSIIKLVPYSPKQLLSADGRGFDDDAVVSLIDQINTHSRRNDMVFRIAEDEYLILCPHTDIDTSTFVAERILEQADTSDILVNNQAEIIRLCAGIASFEQSDDAVSILKRCDRAVLHALSIGAGIVKNCAEDAQRAEDS